MVRETNRVGGSYVGETPIPAEDRQNVPLTHGRVREGIAVWSNSKVGTSTNPVQIAHIEVEFEWAYVVADPGNSTTIAIGSQNEQAITMNPGDVFPFLDAAPCDFWATSGSPAQKVVFVGHGHRHACTTE
jgi:hypothetical protein